MTVVTGDILLRLPEVCTERYQLRLAMDYLLRDGTGRVCALYGLRRTGKTTIILQSIRKLISRGITPDRILFISGEEDQIEDMDSLYSAIDAFINKEKDRGQLYIFIDEVSWFNGFISGAAKLYDYYTRILGTKVVISGTNIVSMYVASLGSLFDRLYTIHVHHLTFFENCKFVLGTAYPEWLDFCRYIQYGGLFERVDTVDYMVTSVVYHLSRTIDTGEPKELWRWISDARSLEIDWEALINNICLYSAANVNERNAVSPHGLGIDARHLREMVNGITIDEEVIRECSKFYGLTGVRAVPVRKTEVVGLLKFLNSCGFLFVLENYAKKLPSDASKMYLTFPFMRYAFTSKLGEFAKVNAVDYTSERGSELMGDLLEGCFVSEYRLANRDHDLFFWREEVDGVYAECDLLDISAGKAFELKWRSSAQYSGFHYLLKAHSDIELSRNDCIILRKEDAMNFIYSLGEGLYSGLDTGRSVFC